MSNSGLMIASMTVSNFSDRLLKVDVLTFVEVLIDDILKIYTCTLSETKFLRRQLFKCLASSSKASAAKIIDTASTVNR